MLSFSWLILIFPLIGFLLISIGKEYFKNASAGVFASVMIFASFILSAAVFYKLPDSATTIHLFNWIQSGSLSIPFAILIDRISVIMLLIITGVGFLIHVYSIGYMKGDEGYARFFSYLNLFIFFMLLLVLGADYIVLLDRKSTRLNSSHLKLSRMPSSA